MYRKKKKKGVLLLCLMFILLLVASITPAIVVAEFVLGQFWSKIDTTVVLTNETDNVSIGANSTTTYKLYVNGSAYINNNLLIANNIYGDSYFGEGGNLTNIAGDGYAGSLGHPHNQDLNISSIVFFDRIYSTFFGDGGNLTNITASGDGYAGSKSHPHDQDLNTSNNVIFESITYNDDMDIFRIDALDNDLYLDVNLAKPPIQIHSTGETTKIYESASRARLTPPSQSIPPMIWTKLLLNVKDYDQNNDYDTINIWFLCPKTGVYHISYSVHIFDLQANAYFMSGIYVNGVLAGGYEISHSSIPSDLANSGSDILSLNANDKIDLYVFHTHTIVPRIFPTSVYSNYLAVCKIA